MTGARHLVPLATLLLCAACGGIAENRNAAIANETEATHAVVDPSAGPTPSTSATGNMAAPATGALSGYVGKYPFDKVGGATFLANPLVTAAVNTAVGEKAVLDWVLDPEAGPSSPIILKDGKLLATGCQAHNCGDHRWTILIDPAGSAAQVCYHDAEQMGETGRWYSAGKRAARTDICPQE